MCATKTCSKFHCSLMHDLESFKWTELLNDMKINAPTLTGSVPAAVRYLKFIVGAGLVPNFEWNETAVLSTWPFDHQVKLPHYW